MTNPNSQNFRTSPLRPGLLVALRTTVSGNVKYTKEVIEAEAAASDGTVRSKWETERVVSNAAELEEATKIRNRARTLITSICAQSDFGLLCPEDKKDNLDQAIGEARALANEFNDRASITRISVNVLAGRVAPDDAEAVRAINSEVTGLLSTMETGLRNLDVKAVREAADRAKSLGSMLSPSAQDRLKDVIDTVRKSAREIIKAGEVGSKEIDLLSIQKIMAARTEFLDVDHALEMEAPEAEGRSLDLAPVTVDDTVPDDQQRDLDIGNLIGDIEEVETESVTLDRPQIEVD